VASVAFPVLSQSFYDKITSFKPIQVWHIKI
jgi:hypothetical protein